MLYCNRSIIPRYRKVVVPSTHTAENHDFVSSDHRSRSSTSNSLFRSARSGNMLSTDTINKGICKARDPEIHQIRKGNEWRFGMKCHVGVDAGSGLVHTVTVTSANKHDITETVNLIREDDEVVYGDSGYLGVQKRSEIQQNEHFSKVDFRINRRPKSLPKVSDHAIDWERYIEHRKSSIRSKVEHVFRIIKCQFGYKKVVYRGLKKNENRLYALFACANLYSLAIAGRKLSTT